MLVRRLILCLCAAGGFTGMAALLHRMVPLQVPEATPKLDYLAAHREDFDTVFIGSSRIYHGVSPRAFDAAMAAGGKRTRSFNLAIDGMMPPESLEMARRLAAMRLPQLRRVFLEVARDNGVPALKGLTVRDVYWQDLWALEYALRRAPLDYQALKGKYRWPKAWEDVSTGALLYARNQFNIGRLAPGEYPGAAQQQRLGAPALGPDGDGFLPENHPMAPGDLAKLEKALEAMREGTVKARPADPLNREDYREIAGTLEERGVEVVLITAPVTTRDFHARVDAPPEMKLLAFDEPDRRPELYAPEHRFDYDHLNGTGALIFSRELAEAYLAGK